MLRPELNCYKKIPTHETGSNSAMSAHLLRRPYENLEYAGIRPSNRVGAVFPCSPRGPHVASATSYLCAGLCTKRARTLHCGLQNTRSLFHPALADAGRRRYALCSYSHEITSGPACQLPSRQMSGLTRRPISYIEQVSWLAARRKTSPSHKNGMQWDIEVSLPAYSDRIAQDSHLIPSR